VSGRFFVTVNGPSAYSQQIELGVAGPLTVGRDASCDIVLPSPEVSRFHLTVERTPSGLRITDQSANGTTVDGERLHYRGADAPLRSELQIGPFAVRIDWAQDQNSEASDGAGLRHRLHRTLLDELNLASLDVTAMDDSLLRDRVVEALGRIVADPVYRVSDPARQARLIADMTDEVLGLGPLQGLLDDDDVSEIMVVDPKTIYAERAGKIELTALEFIDDESCRAAIERIVTPLGRRIDESAPLVDARLDDGSRVNAVIPPLAIRGPCLTIRKFAKAPLQMQDLVAKGAISEPMALFLQRCVRAKKNIVVSGGTGSGKTTLLNVLSVEIPATERIVTIEDAAELQLDQPHVVSLESKPSNLEGQGEYSIRDLLRNALRMRPDRILVGECRAGEAVDMLQAMNTGHEGSMTTTHANSVAEAMKRLETLCMMAGLNLPVRAIREQIASSIHIVVQQARFSDGSRRVISIAEVGANLHAGELLLHEVFSFHRIGTGVGGDVLGSHRPTGYVPSFLDEFIAQGLVDSGGYL